eukprot:CAMPEP_0185026714 /NCGR_PEP_ID=MMETSP1103-20130426/11021_1 /TAXON_ID=36769 /ORGANISM="Paraphysomonas bandaiensis, Strain Caron Lab Isolate" /LENGTH=674 /DNA_ID=CAMNT_0027560381 /DNA_START=263 /DNA_END=2284 /DNA_ORIENTATION=+
MSSDDLRGYDDLEKVMIVGLSIAVPITLDLLLDLKLPRRDTGPRWFYVLTLVVPTIIIMLRNSMEIFICSDILRDLLVRGTLLSHVLHDREMKPWRWGALWATLIIFVIQQHVRIASLLSHRYYTSVIVMSFIAFIATLLQCIYSAYAIYCSRYKLNKRNTNGQELYCNHYMLLLGLHQVLKWVVYLSLRRHMESNEVFAEEMMILGTPFTCVHIAVCVIAATLSSRISRYDKARAEYLYEKKQSFVSHLSRQMQLSMATLYTSLKSANEMCTSLTHSSALRRLISDSMITCARIESHIDDLLYAEELDEDSAVMKFSDVSIQDVVVNSLKPMEYYAKHCHVSLKYTGLSHMDHSAVGAVISADISKFTQALRNVVSNALARSPAGEQVDVYTYVKRSSSVHENARARERQAASGRVAVTDKDQDSGYVVRIEVFDRGPGITEEERDAAFSDATDLSTLKHGSSGFGLWVAKSIITLHRGEMGFVVRDGCMVYMELQLVPPFEVVGITEGSRFTRSLSATFEHVQNSVSATGMVIHSDSVDASRIYFPRVLVLESCASAIATYQESMTDCVEHVEIFGTLLELEARLCDCKLMGYAISVVFLGYACMEYGGANCIYGRLRELGYEGAVVIVVNDNGEVNIEHELNPTSAVLHSPVKVCDVQLYLKELDQKLRRW